MFFRIRFELIRKREIQTSSGSREAEVFPVSWAEPVWGPGALHGVACPSLQHRTGSSKRLPAVWALPPPGTGKHKEGKARFTEDTQLHRSHLCHSENPVTPNSKETGRSGRPLSIQPEALF